MFFRKVSDNKSKKYDDHEKKSFSFELLKNSRKKYKSLRRWTLIGLKAIYKGLVSDAKKASVFSYAILQKKTRLQI